MVYQPGPASPPALLLLEDGHYFAGRSLGFSNQISIRAGQLSITDSSRLCGELCFNTGMSGYQEVLSDPSYAGQMICFSFPHIGNAGCNREDHERLQAHALGLICREYPTSPSNWRSEMALLDWLEQQRIGGICGLDTRALISHLRERGSQRALLGRLGPELLDSSGCVPKQVLELLLGHLRASPDMSGQDLASKVSCEQPLVYGREVMRRWLPIESHAGTVRNGQSVSRKLHVAVLDFGIKENILQSLQRFVAKVTVLPLQSCWQDIAALRPDGLFLSNGPGDPQPVYPKIAPVLQQSFAAKLPIFGICLGHQFLALSLGAKITYMHHGHRGVNHPVLNLNSNTVEITSQNHGFCVTEDDLPPSLEVSHRSLFDLSIEGIRSLEQPAFSVQYHPDASPGPHDSLYLFREFVDLMEKCPNVFSN